MTVSFYGGETTGGVADRRIDTTTAKQETTGGVGVRKNQESIFTVDNDLQQDTVCFRGNENGKKSSVTEKIFWGTLITAGLVTLAGLCHKYDWVGKISNKRAQNFFRHTDTVTEPCHKALAWVKKNCYDKVANLFRNK